MSPTDAPSTGTSTEPSAAEQALRALVQRQLELSKQQRARIAELEAQRFEPLAVVGLGIRLPGGITDADSFWRLLTDPDAEDVIIPIPADRPSLRQVHRPGKAQAGSSYVENAGFLTDIASFDANFWGISAREAESLDPQQRLLLETGWEALEDAGIPVDRGGRRSAGVWVGMMSSEYTSRITADGDYARIDPYFGTGGGHSFAAGRLSYALGLTGPAMTVDTACSSSLVALHLATRSLRSREVDLALVGGANLILGPELMVSLSQTGALAPDGRSKTFLADADGYGRGEGVGVLALMRLSDAEQGRHPIRAVIRGSAVNHDGASSGLTVPNGVAQQEVLRAALADSGVAAHEVGYIEAHGTGTSLGDPIEVAAIDAVLGSGAPERTAPLRLGSLKSRIGHLEAAAGIAGLVKAVLVVERGVVPAATPTPDGRLNPLIPWDHLAVTVPARPAAWTGDEPRIAGVNAFGLSGTNAHALLAQYRSERTPAESPARPQLVVVSAKTQAALGVLVEELCARLERATPAEFASMAHTLRVGRTHQQRRLAVTATTPGQAAAALQAQLRADAPAPATSSIVDVRIGDASQVLEAVSRTIAGRPALDLAGQAVADGDAATAVVRVLEAFGITARTVRGNPATGTLVSLSIGDVAISLYDVDGAPDLGLPSAVATLYRMGLAVHLAPLAGPDDVLVAGLPGHPFLRRTFWLPDAGVARLSSAAAESLPVPPALHLAAKSLDVAALRRDDLEELLLRELAAIFKADAPLDRRESFQERGGDSFAAMMLTKSIEAEHGVTLDADEFPMGGTLGELVESLATQIRLAQLAEAEAS